MHRNLLGRQSIHRPNITEPPGDWLRGPFEAPWVGLQSTDRYVMLYWILSWCSKPGQVVWEWINYTTSDSPTYDASYWTGNLQGCLERATTMTQLKVLGLSANNIQVSVRLLQLTKTTKIALIKIYIRKRHWLWIQMLDIVEMWLFTWLSLKWLTLWYYN